MGQNAWRRGAFALAVATTVLVATVGVQNASAADRRWGLSVGYGGEGVTASVNNNGVTQSASRSEGPLVLGIFVEQLMSDTFVFGIEHVRGVSLLPATSEAWFMGVLGRWYFFGQAPSTAHAPDNTSTILVKRFVPFLGFSAGFAQANIERQGEAVGNVAGSGLYLGFRVGADYMMAPGRGIRPELITSSTDFSSSFANASAGTPPSLVMFSIQCSWFFDF